MQHDVSQHCHIYTATFEQPHLEVKIEGDADPLLCWNAQVLTIES